VLITCRSVTQTDFASKWRIYKSREKRSRLPIQFKLTDRRSITYLSGLGQYPSSCPPLPFKSADKIIFAYNHNNEHWVALAIEMEPRIIKIYDSMQDHDCNWNEELSFLSGGLDEVLLGCGKEYEQRSEWVIERPKVIQQDGG
jgi:hypothetical protein